MVGGIAYVVVVGPDSTAVDEDGGGGGGGFCGSPSAMSLNRCRTAVISLYSLVSIVNSARGTMMLLPRIGIVLEMVKFSVPEGIVLCDLIDVARWNLIVWPETKMIKHLIYTMRVLILLILLGV